MVRYCSLRKAFIFGIIAFVLTHGLIYMFFDRIFSRKVASADSEVRQFIEIGTQTDASFSRTLSYRKDGNVDDLSVKTSSYSCKPPDIVVDGMPWPDCITKMQWMKDNAASIKCYGTQGVRADDNCSILKYLSTQEKYCPPLTYENPKRSAYFSEAKCSPRNDFRQLYYTLSKSADYSWIKHRISTMEVMWTRATKNLFSNMPALDKKRIHIHLGLLTTGIGTSAWKGGPLGELVQWSDVIASLYSIGHEVVVSYQKNEIAFHYSKYMKLFSTSSTCTPKSVYEHRNIPFDIVYTDINGYNVIKTKLGDRAFQPIRCRCRIVDSFGTEALFNHPPYRDRLGIPATQYNGLDVKLQQFNTMFPHTPDNTFLGFVTEFPPDISAQTGQTHDAKKIALVYGKSKEFWRGKDKYLKIVSEYFEVHATVAGVERLPRFVINHGLVNRTVLAKLLSKTKLFVGLGFPFEGPAPLEAIQHGAVFLNPKYAKPVSSLNNDFYKGKPTLREITSQNPYAEEYIGEPYVYTIDVDNEKELRQTLIKVSQADSLPGYLPREYSVLGMLERLTVHVDKQQFCNEIPYAQNPSPDLEKMRWPPIEAMRCISSYPHVSKSCNDVCSSAGLICEPTYFPVINRIESFSGFDHKFPCSRTAMPRIQDTFHPSFDRTTGKCYVQNNPRLFSCSGSGKNHYRICPCRDYIRGQVALCKSCGPSIG